MSSSGEIPISDPEDTGDTVGSDDAVDSVDSADSTGDTSAYMTASVGASLLAPAYPDLVGVVVARAGSPDPLVEAGTMTELAEGEFGDPLHLLVIPGTVHLLEADALVELAGADRETLEIQ